MILDMATSRALGHTSDLDGETQDERTVAATHAEIMADAKVLARSLGRTVEVYATHPKCSDWCVAAVEPS